MDKHLLTEMKYTEQGAAHNNTTTKGGFSCYTDNFVVTESSVLGMKFSAKNTALCQAPIHYTLFKKNYAHETNN